MRISLYFIFLSLFRIVNSQTALPIAVDYTELKVTDTLSMRSDSVLVKMAYFNNAQLVGESTAYLLPDTISDPKFPRISRKHFVRRVPMTKIVRHGATIEYFNEFTRISRYALGKVVSRKVYDADKKEVSQDLLPKTPGPCSETTTEYLIDGKKSDKQAASEHRYK